MYAAPTATCASSINGDCNQRCADAFSPGARPRRFAAPAASFPLLFGAICSLVRADGDVALLAGWCPRWLGWISGGLARRGESSHARYASSSSRVEGRLPSSRISIQGASLSPAGLLRVRARIGTSTAAPRGRPLRIGRKEGRKEDEGTGRARRPAGARVPTRVALALVDLPAVGTGGGARPDQKCGRGRTRATTCARGAARTPRKAWVLVALTGAVVAAWPEAGSYPANEISRDSVA